MAHTKSGNTYLYTPKANPKDWVDVEIGDIQQANFFPQVKIKRWDNECNLSYRLNDLNIPGNVTVTDDGEKITWQKKQGQKVWKAIFYHIPEGEGGFEFEISLPAKPPQNYLEFTLEDKNVSYFYQPELTQEEIDEGCFRPENVVGSYVVYASEHKTNWVGGKEYRTGQIGIIYRPKAVDSIGTEVWGELNIIGNVLTITIPQSFLDTAVYPVLVDPTFGYETAGASSVSLSKTTAKWINLVDTHTASTGDVVVSCTIYANCETSANDLYFTPYSVVGGVPTSPVDATGALVAVPTDPLAWYESSQVSFALTNGVIYGTAARLNAATTNTAIKFNAGSAPGRLNSSSATFTDPFAVSGADSGRHYSFYARYRPSSGTVTETYSHWGTFTWKAPTGISSVDVACWGAGGSGDYSSNNGGGGGGGGAYAKSTVAVTAGNSYTVVIGRGGITNGAAGDDTTFNGTTVVAAGGSGGVSVTGGAGGAVADSTGDTKTKGGDGGSYDSASTDDNSGGGGGAAGPDGEGVVGDDGLDPVGGDGGAGDNGSGGAGGAGGNGGNGAPGADNILGGGGGGGGDNGMAGGTGGIPGGGGGGSESQIGVGDGGWGQCSITYTFGGGAPSLDLLVSGAWKSATLNNIMVNGAWKTVASAKVLVNGAWKSI